jgi:hypothetical protein
MPGILYICAGLSTWCSALGRNLCCIRIEADLGLEVDDEDDVGVPLLSTRSPGQLLLLYSLNFMFYNT